MKRTWLLLVMLCVAMLASGPVSALDPARTIKQYKHTRWTTEEGAPAVMVSLAQGADGYLWIGARDGLFRFDGVTFENIPPEHYDNKRSSVSAVLAARDGSVWAGYSNGGMARFRAGVLRDAALPHPDAFVINLQETRDGAIWALLGRRELPLARFHNGRWEEIGTNWGLPLEYALDILAARDGTLWVSMTESIYFLKPGTRRFSKAAETPVGHAALSQDPAGRVWLSDTAGARPMEGRPAGYRSYPVPPSPRAVSARFDRDGNLWSLPGHNGLVRIRSPLAAGETTAAAASAKVEAFAQRDGLTSDTASDIMEDHEGNIWVGTVLGLDRFRPARVVAEPLLTLTPKWGSVLLGTANGTMYVGQADGVYRILPAGNPERVLANAGETEALCEGPDGAVWMAMEHRLFRYADGRFDTFTRPKTRQAVTDCAVDRHNMLWLSGDEGLFRHAPTGWQLFDLPGTDESSGARTLVADHDRRLLAFASAQSLRLIDFPRYSDIVLNRPGALSRLRTLQEGSGGVLIGGRSGLVRVRGGIAQFVGTRRVPALRGLNGVVQTPAGQTWTMGSRGITYMSTAALNRAFDDPRFPLQPTILDFRDGLSGVNSGDGTRDAARGGDGRVWFATNAGTVWVDADHFVRNTLPPRVAISALKVGGTVYRDPANLTLPVGSSTARIDFTALSLAIPERVRFRYRLDGVDRDWMDPGTMRQAAYTNLTPGDYRFQVIASNNDGVWNRTGATLDFTIRPTFLQSGWFKLLCLIGVGALLWLAYSIRLRQVTARVRAGLEVRLAERERIARELHDTLLQGFQGLVLRFQSIANRIPPDQPLRPLMDDALDRAEAVLVEGRDRVRELRATSGDLTQTLLDTAHELAATWPVRFDLTIEGSPRALHPMVRDEIQHIGEEALRNAFQHAKASTIEAVIIYLPGELRFDLRDDGTGLPADIASSGEREGHFGLIGMRERATRIGGTLTISSRKGAGTEILLSIPGAAAYAERRGRRWLPRFLTGRMKG
jgi:signal transduction histidine kinase/ligand-binding sensor domain-containing protein